jgi:predicted amidohydrolase
MSDRDKIKVAIVQHPPVFMNLEESLIRAREYIREVSANGAEVIAFGETWLSGYPIWFDFAPEAARWNHPGMNELFQLFYKNSIALDSEHIKTLINEAVDAGAYVIMGANERDGNTIYNTMVYIDPVNKNLKHHRKLIPTYTERLVWGRGDGSTLETVKTDFGNLGGLICWEHWMPLARAAMHAQKEVIHIAQWPGVHELHQVCSRHYAFEGRCFVLACGTVLTRNDIIEGVESLGIKSGAAYDLLMSMPDKRSLIDGGSTVIAPDISYVAGPVCGENEIVYAELDLSRIVEASLTMDSAGHYARPDIFELKVNTARQVDVSFGRGEGEEG